LLAAKRNEPSLHVRSAARKRESSGESGRKQGKLHGSYRQCRAFRGPEVSAGAIDAKNLMLCSGFRRRERHLGDAESAIKDTITTS
jgi:hypothetical protein